MHTTQELSAAEVSGSLKLSLYSSVQDLEDGRMCHSASQNKASQHKIAHGRLAELDSLAGPYVYTRISVWTMPLCV